MAAREDLLRELGLLPQWRRRSRPGLAVTLPASNAPAVPAEEVAGGSALATEAAVEELPVAAPVPPGGAATGEDRAFQASNPLAEAAPVVPHAPAAAGPGGGDAVPSSTPGDSADADARRSRIATLEWPAFAADVDTCTACKLARTRNRSVPGVGDVRADWLFVGEAPGSEEDARGEPFVGQAGRLLDNMLGALGLARADRVYIANVLKCRPPGNRTPEPLEVAACLPYLDRQIALIRPKLIVALGKSAATALLQVEATIASLRGRVHRYRDLPLVVTYHPAYLLRSLVDKAKAWDDLLLARRTMTQAAPEREAGNAES